MPRGAPKSRSTLAAQHLFPRRRRGCLAGPRDGCQPAAGQDRFRREHKIDHYNVFAFWFDELTPEDWFRKDPELDRTCRERFGALLERARACELWGWRVSPEGRLAEVLLLDQLGRNIHRDSAAAFTGDALALALAQEAVVAGADIALPIDQRKFFYMPYMHSESLAVHIAAEPLFAQPGLEDNARFEVLHREIIERFGRYPHRNAPLGRASTPEELAFLEEPGSRF